MADMNTETPREPGRQAKPAKPAPFSYPAMFKSSSTTQSPAKKPAPKAQPKVTEVLQQEEPSFRAPAAKLARVGSVEPPAESIPSEGEAATTELEGLGAAPAGVTGNTAFQKGSTFYKEGQYPNAIKWLSWALDLLQKEGTKATHIEALTRRMSCFKEIGEYKKAIADCTMACDLDVGNIDLLMQRAFLYEGCEKYKLGMADLREVLKIDPDHHTATVTLARLEKMLDY